MFVAYIQKARFNIWAALAAFAAAAFVTVAWSPAAGAEPPEPPPPVEQQPDANDADDTSRPETPRPDTSSRRDRRSPVVLKKQPISKVRYILGGLIGSYYGFGVGHLIVGEWGTTGWFYTVSEAMSATVMMVGLYRSLERAHGTEDGRDRRPSEASQRTNNAMLFGGGIALLVLRVSEIADLWTRPEVASAPRDDDDTAFALSPSTTPGGGLGASFSWSW